jgi:uncharacterized protein
VPDKTLNPLAKASLGLVKLRPQPLAPGTIREGNPVPRAALISCSTDGLSYTMAWECPAGKFNWNYKVDETVHIVEGQVSVALPGQPDVVLRAGDVATFRAGTTAHWTVDAYVRKVAFCQRILPSPARFVAKAYWKLRSLAKSAKQSVTMSPIRLRSA